MEGVRQNLAAQLEQRLNARGMGRATSRDDTPLAEVMGLLMRERMTQAIAEDTGQTLEQISIEIDRDFILRGEDEVAYGLVDEILTKQDPIPVEALR